MYLSCHSVVTIETTTGDAPGNERSFSPLNLVRFQVLTAATMKMTVFWDVTPYSFVEVIQGLESGQIL
jgi:hypothetical protein